MWGKKPGIQIDIPGHGKLDIRYIVTDYTGTHSCGGVISEGALDLFRQLSERVDILILTSDTFGTVRKTFDGLDVQIKILEGEKHDQQKADFVRELGAHQVAAFGNGQNDRWMLAVVKEACGLSVAVDNGEGCAWDSISHAQLLIHGAKNALMLLVDTRRVTATLRF